MLRTVTTWIVFLWTAIAFGRVDDAVVMVDGCSGVCIDPAGLVLTAKHCGFPETVQVRFKHRTVRATRISVCRETEGPVVYDCDGDGFPHLPVAATAPRVGECLWSYGYPRLNGRRELRDTRGPLLRWGSFQYAGGSFNGNVVRIATSSGWSGGPLLNAKAEVCGLLNSSDGVTSVFISSAAVRDAYTESRHRTEPREPNTPADRKPTLYVFGSMTCTPCREFKQDYAKHKNLRDALDAAYTVEFVDIDKQPELARRFNVDRVPAFVISGRAPITGYQGAEELLIAMGVKQAQPPPEDPTPVADSNQRESTQPAEDPAPPENAEPTPTPIPPIAEHIPGTASDKPTPATLDRIAGVAEKAVKLAKWLGITGATGGTAGLILGSVALWRTLRKRKQRQRPARDPPDNQQPAVVTVDTPSPPQAILPDTRFTPYERDTFAEAFVWAETELARKYPGSVGTLESLRGLIDQYLAAKGFQRASRSD
ncbi:MAG: trypsin-like peptidase domain-containing protein [Planctomycetaceae bacterium]